MKQELRQSSVLIPLIISMLLAFNSVLNVSASQEGFTLEHSEEWHIMNTTYAYVSPAADMDKDGTMEIVTVGWYENGSTWAGGNVRHGIIRIWTWNGFKLELEHEELWNALGNHLTRLIKWGAIADVDGDGVKELITAGQTFIDTPIGRWYAELGIWTWNGSVLELEHAERWYTTSADEIYDVNVYDVDEDGVEEIITLGIYWLGPTYLIYGSQMRIWNWNGTILTLEHTMELYDVSIYLTYQKQSFFADVDQDGIVEIVITGYTQQLETPKYAKGKIWIWNWNGTSLVEEHSEGWGNFSSSGHGSAFSVLAEDLDNDGIIEIVTCGNAHSSPQHGCIKVWTWNGSYLSLLHTEKWNSTHDVRVYNSNIIDVNEDGTTELVTVGMFHSTHWKGQLRIWQWNTTQGLHLLHSTEWTAPGPVDTFSVCVEDVDEDSIEEIITTGVIFDGIQINGQLRIWYLPLKTVHTVNWGEDIFDVITLSNSTIFDLVFSQPEMHINFNVTVPTNMMGFCNVTIPLELLGGPYTCLLDGSPVTTIETSNSTHASLYITYNYGGYVQITGTTVIPEFPNILTVLLLLPLLILVLLHTKKKGIRAS